MLAVNVMFIWGTYSFPELSSGVCCHVIHWKSTEVSEEHIASIYRIEETKQLCFLPASWWFLPWIIFPPQKWRRYIPPKRRLTLSGLGLLDACFTLVSCLAYYSTLKMEATCSSETFFDFHWTVRRYIPEDRNIHNHLCEKLKSYIFMSSGRMKNLLQRTIWSRYKSSGLPCEMCSSSSRHGAARPRVAGGGDSLHVWRVAPNTHIE
jgi:hypothetical protein